MRLLATLLALLAGGCAVPGYYVRPADLGAAATPAVRARDGASVMLRGNSYRATAEPPRTDGSVVVRGPGRHGPRWKSGLVTFVAGSLLSLAGAVLAIVSAGSCLSGPCTGSSGKLYDEVYWLGIGLSVSGDMGAGIVGPALMISGAQQRPVELR